MENIVIIRYSEISLKGNNRIVFEKRLIDNIKDCLKKNKVKYEKIERLRGRIIIFAEQELNCLKYVFGISSFSHALVIESEIKEIEKTVSKIIENKKFRSFRVSAQRLNKNFSLTSPEIERTIGSFVCEKLNKKVSLKNFDLEIGIEILDKAYVFTERV
ncbi:tRNA 4-thiouridine(8) synthase ThiI, partial [Candidatus Woesearchaeota archaeon]|nr:tRNA 4-thiouridine(8) synthase ThiI [Candidatus Woesearchaeota archaeon]